MTARTVFQEALDARRKIRSIQRRQAYYRDMAVSTAGMSEVRIRSLTGRSRVERAALELVQLADQLEGQAEQYAGAVARAEALIRAIKKPRHQQVLELRYLAGLPWRAVADAMGYADVKSVFRVHGWALLEAQRLLEEKNDFSG